MVTMNNKQIIVVSLIAVLIGGIIGGAFVQNQSAVEINELRGELAEAVDAYGRQFDRVEELEEAIEIIVMERTTYIELSFAEIQRLRAELNVTRQLLLNCSIPSS